MVDSCLVWDKRHHYVRWERKRLLQWSVTKWIPSVSWLYQHVQLPLLWCSHPEALRQAEGATSQIQLAQYPASRMTCNSVEPGRSVRQRRDRDLRTRPLWPLAPGQTSAHREPLLRWWLPWYTPESLLLVFAACRSQSALLGAWRGLHPLPARTAGARAQRKSYKLVRVIIPFKKLNRWGKDNKKMFCLKGIIQKNEQENHKYSFTNAH